MSIPTGDYLIVNGRYHNLAFLPDINKGTTVVAVDDRGNSGGKWNVVKLENRNYILRNVGHASYANTGAGCKDGSTVDGQPREQQWAIIDTDVQGQFLIATVDRQLFWGLRSVRARTPIVLSANDSDPANWWIFKSVHESENYSSVDSVDKSRYIPSEIRLCTQLFNQGQQDDGIPSYHLSDDALRMAVLKSHVWENGSTLRIRFMTENEELEAKVRQHAPEWTQYANVKFQFVKDGDAEIRISFDKIISSFSYIGTQSQGLSQDERTMNIDPNTSDADTQKVILHEFGHALGCVHEHQSPIHEIPWRKDRVYRYYYENFKWSSSVVDRNLFKRHHANVVANTSFDPESIMMYEVPAELTITGLSFSGGSRISEKDKEWIAKMYPVPVPSYNLC